MSRRLRTPQTMQSMILQTLQWEEDCPTSSQPGCPLQRTNGHWKLYPKAMQEFQNLPPNRFLCSPASKKPQKLHIRHQAILHLLQIDAIELVPKNQEYTGIYSIFFTVPKKNGDWRSVLDLKFINSFIKLKHFHMESLKSITDALQPGEFLTSLDLTEAYLHVPIRPSHRRFLRFCIDHKHF